MRLAIILGSLLLFARVDHLLASKSQCADESQKPQQPQQRKCSSVRPTVCTLEYNPVCGYFKEGCPEGLCPKTLGNSCQACADETVVYYTPGACEQESLLCAATTFATPCSEAVDPVCAKLEGGKPTTYKNACIGCGQAASSWQKPGACVADTFSCALALFNPECPKTVDPVCAVRNDGSEVTYNNACFACQGDAGSLIKLGACQTDTFSCATALFPPKCPKTLSAVCSVRKNGKETTYNNECLACKGDAGSLIKKGACPSDTFSCALALFAPKCPNSPHPVCGVTTKGKQTTYKNECFACKKAAGDLIKIGACGKN